MASAAVSPNHRPGSHGCYTTCSTRTSLDASIRHLTFGQEQLEVFTVSVRPRFHGSSGTPTGTATVQTSGIVLCTVTLSGGTGACSPTSTALPEQNFPYWVTASYSGDATFAPSTSWPVVIKVPPAKSCPPGHGHGGHGGRDGHDHGCHGHGH